MSRWVELYTTSPSGKTLFVCKYCGRISPLPDRTCSSPPEVVSWKASLSCEILEELESALIDVGELQVERRIAMQISLPTDATEKRGIVSWSTPLGAHRSTQFEIKEKLEQRDGALWKIPQILLRTPEGFINNCSLAHGEDEASCQVCNGNCPDRDKVEFNESRSRRNQR